MLELGLKVLVSYLLGSLNGALIVGRFEGVDIRKVGSGNPGGTNALRTQGRWFAARVMMIDVLKGWLPAAIFPALVLPVLPPDPAISREWLAVACAGGAIIGHCYPVFFDFAGGKGAATAVGALAGIAPWLLLPGGIVWALVLMTTGFVGLATMLAAAALPVAVILRAMAGDAAVPMPLFSFVLLLALFIAFTHRANIRRMALGAENRIEKAMVLRRAR